MTLLFISAFSFSIVQGVVSCGDNISASTTLTSNLSNCTGFALSINVSDVVLDCAGYTISPNETAYWDGAIYVYDVNNVTIKNCTINGLNTGGTGVTLSGGNSHTIIYNRFYGLTQAIIITSSNELGYLNISNNYINASGTYAFELNLSNSTIDNNTLLNTGACA